MEYERIASLREDNSPTFVGLTSKEETGTISKLLYYYAVTWD